VTTLESVRPVVRPDGSRKGSETTTGEPRSGVPFLEARRDGLAERFSEWLGTDRPVLTFLVAVLGGYLLLVAGMVALGFALTKILLQIGGVSEWDESVSDWLARHRTPNLEHLSWVGSTLAGGLVIPCVIAFFLAVFLALHHWRLAAFVLFAVAIESGGYRATSLIVPRERPSVPRLESLPVDASYPSGHTAASIALYGGLLLLLISRVRSTALTVLAWVLILTVPLFVGWARMYRGMHHLTDTAAGVLLGIGALVVIVFAARAAGATSERRDAHRGATVQ
jgi:membrane-associated phospholipid phosphatase